MTSGQERDLVGRVETQALYDERLVVTGTSGSWLHVVAPDQGTSRDSRGYPGWVPARQVSASAPPTTAEVATVVSRTAWLRGASGRDVVEVSVATRLPVLARTSAVVTVAGPGQVRLAVDATEVAVARRGAAAEPLSSSGVLASARGFLGVPYLWGGRSGFAVDCSGFTELVYLLHGVAVPRDTGDQVRAGRLVSVGDVERADLVFFGTASEITHVGLVVGPGQMIHAPGTGSTVMQAAIGSPAAARRFL